MSRKVYSKVAQGQRTKGAEDDGRALVVASQLQLS
jgi:hypothetical protein